MDDLEKQAHVCVDCGTASPTTQTAYTLISSQHGWRLKRRVDPIKGLIFEWRCPSCWVRLKQP